MSSTRLFISHATADKVFVRDLKYYLSQLGHDVWVDEDRIAVGDSLLRSIERGIIASDYVIVVVSREALRRPWFKQELAAAYSLEISRRRKIILPVLIDRVSIPLMLRDKKYADFRKSFEEGLSELLAVFGPSLRIASQDKLYAMWERITLTIHDSSGASATYRRQSELVCTQASITHIVYRLAVDGSMSDFKVRWGVVENIRKEAGVTYVTTRLDRVYKRGEKFPREISFSIHNTFVDAENYWEGTQQIPSRYTDYRVVFPKLNQPKTYSVDERVGTEILPLSKKPRLSILRGHPTLFYRVDYPPLHNGYILRWKWQ